jgi:hypothetical protein
MSQHESFVELSFFHRYDLVPELSNRQQRLRRDSPHTVRVVSPVTCLVVSPESRGKARTD